MNKLLYLLTTLIVTNLCFCFFAFAKNIDITQYGAKGDGISLNTKIIQNAVDSCAATGGGKVIIPSGTFLSGTVYLKSKVNLYLEEGAVLKGSTRINDYLSEGLTYALLLAVNVHQIAVTGLGVIDGNGHHENYQKGEGKPGRPMILFFLSCNEVVVKDITLRNPAFWTQKYMGCENVSVTGISVYAHANWNNDGIDMDSKDVIIADCRFDTNDDAICLKSERKEPCENVTITNCIVASNCNGIKFGTAGYGGFVNINISNCVIHQASEDKIWQWQKRLTNITNINTVISGLALECVDGGNIDHVNISNITMKDVQTPIFIRLGSRHLPTGTLQHVNISNVIATSESSMSNTISGVPGHYVQDVTIHDIMLINHAKGVININIDSIPENRKGYPENRMFGTELPAAGFYVRHVAGITLKNISLQTATGEQRPFLVADDVRDLQVDDAGIKKTDDTVYPIMYHLRNVSKAMITVPVFLPAYSSLIHVEGSDVRNINIFLKEQIDMSRLIFLGKEMKNTDAVKVFPQQK